MKRYFLGFLTIIPVIAILSGCSPEDQAELENIVSRDPLDRKADLTRGEAELAIRPHRPNGQDGKPDAASSSSVDVPIPPLSAVVLAPDAPEIESEKRISLTVTETIELRDVLLELARLADLELALDPAIKGGIILSVKNRPVGQVLELVADLADLKYTVENGVLRVANDHPYLVNYSVDYLNIKRSSKGSIDTSTSAGSGSSGGSSGGSGGSSGGSGGSSGGSGGSSGGSGGSSGGSSSFNSGSSNQIETETDGDLWASIEANIDSIITSQYANLAIGDGEVAEVVGQQASSQTRSTGAGRGGDAKSSYTLNKQAGIISVLATYRKHKAVKEYLDMVMSSMSAQVLIEAKVLEVELNDSYATGIDWTLARGSFTSAASFPFAIGSSSTFLNNNVFTGVLGSASSIKFAHSTNDVLSFLNGFGLTRTLSNPRITIQNNQQAVLTFARNEAYFSLSVTPATTTSTGGGAGTTTTATFTSSLQTTPIGVIMALQPSINLATQEVTLHIRPTLTSKVGEVEDPAVKLNAIQAGAGGSSAIADQIAALSSRVPVVQVRELDTVLKAKSGDVMVIGGLIQHMDNNADVGVPFLSNIPLLGNAVKKVEKRTTVVETVILMTAKIITPNANYHEHDKKMYDTFTQDPRPFAF